MGKIWEFYENMNELVYVSDMDNYEILYMNRKAREMYQLESVADLGGRKCYEVLQGCVEPCSICTNQQLIPGQFLEWMHYNPLVQRPYALKDTMLEEDGRRCRFELAIDMTEQENQKEIIMEYVNNEAMLNEALRVSLASSVPNESLDMLLAYLGKALQSERVYIFEENVGDSYSNTYEWCREGISPQKDNLQNISSEVAAIWMNQFSQKQGVIISDLEEIRESDPLMYDCLKPQNIHSLVVGPLVDGDHIIGFFGVDNPPAHLLGNISTFFQIIAHFIVSLLRRRNLVRRLTNLSYYDQLTSCRNRHALERDTSRLEAENTLGMVFVDVTGLKRINDSEGHQAGDALLLRACACLRHQFPQHHLYRLGGDEFLVLCPGITEPELNEQVQQLKREMSGYRVVLAIGSVWCPDSRENIDHLLSLADRRMYADKRAYYESIGGKPD